MTSIEAEQARASVEQTRAQLPLLRTAIEQNRHALAMLTGQPPAAMNVLLAASGPVPKAGATLALGFPADTLRQRPDIRAAEFQVLSAVALVAQAVLRGELAERDSASGVDGRVPVRGQSLALAHPTTAAGGRC